MIDNVYTLIQAMTNYTVPAADKPLIQYLWDAAENDLLALTNLKELPKGLDPLHVRMTAGQYIRCRIDEMSGDEGTRVVNSITEGKVTVRLSGESTAERLANLAGALNTPDRELIACFRKLQW